VACFSCSSSTEVSVYTPSYPVKRPVLFLGGQVVAQSITAGATLLRAVTDEFFGDRTGMVTDPFGHKWQIATRNEDVAPEEMPTRMNASYS
jgi:hypothetical protein